MTTNTFGFATQVTSSRGPWGHFTYHPNFQVANLETNVVTYHIGGPSGQVLREYEVTETPPKPPSSTRKTWSTAPTA